MMIASRTSSSTPKVPPPSTVHVVRCAIYTRKSTEEGLEQAFNSLDAQRDAGEAYIASQKTEGWVCLPQHYDDGGYTGGNLERPAMQRLMRDIASGTIDCVVVYKVDRLSRSLLDFARLMDVFDRHKVAFVSVTQHFNTKHSMGRLTLNILLSFAQFEREIISERTRDKIAATRRKGKYSGGPPVLGYDIVAAAGGSRLVVNDSEAERVREIFELYLKAGSLLATVKELARRGTNWTNKHWLSKKGRLVGGRKFDKASLHNLLTNPIYIGRTRYKSETFPGEHQAIIPPEVWQRVQEQLSHHSRGGTEVRNKYGALLKGLIRCAACGCAMAHSYTVRGNKRYRYYTCINAQKRGWDTCPGPSVPAGEMEQWVINQIRVIGHDPDLARETWHQAGLHQAEVITKLTAEQAALQRELKDLHDQVRRHAGSAEQAIIDLLADLQEQIVAAERRMVQIQEELRALGEGAVSEDEVAFALGKFDPLWNILGPREQADLIHHLVECVEYDARAGTVDLTFRPTGIKSLMNHEPLLRHRNDSEENPKPHPRPRDTRARGEGAA